MMEDDEVSGLGTRLGPHHIERRDGATTSGAIDPSPATKVPEPADARDRGGSMTIAVDFDGVLFDHVPYVLRGFRDAHGIDLAEEGLRYWDFFQYRAVRENDLTWRCVREVLDDIETDPVLHKRPPKDPRAAEVMERWLEAGHRVEVVTARQEKSREVTELFLAHHRIPYEDLVMDAGRKLGYDVLIDDSPHNVLMAAAAGSISLLMDQRYNQDVPAENNPLRVHTWEEIGRILGRPTRPLEVGP